MTSEEDDVGIVSPHGSDNRLKPRTSFGKIGSLGFRRSEAALRRFPPRFWIFSPASGAIFQTSYGFFRCGNRNHVMPPEPAAEDNHDPPAQPDSRDCPIARSRAGGRDLLSDDRKQNRS